MPDYPEKLNRRGYDRTPPQNHDVAMTDQIDDGIRKPMPWVPVGLTFGDQRDFPPPPGSEPSGYPSSAVSAPIPGSRGPKKLG